MQINVFLTLSKECNSQEINTAIRKEDATFVQSLWAAPNSEIGLETRKDSAKSSWSNTSKNAQMSLFPLFFLPFLSR